MAKTVTVLSYAGCSTCKKALRWLADNDVQPTVRPIVDEPPTRAELKIWIPESGLPIRRWLNTSGLSYRALGKAAVDAMTDAQLVDALAKDGKLVRRPVLVRGDRVLVGFDEEAYADVFG
ncbi:MAG: arsenate reductase family protein [Polyangia bacterium]